MLVMGFLDMVLSSTHPSCTQGRGVQAQQQGGASEKWSGWAHRHRGHGNVIRSIADLMMPEGVALEIVWHDKTKECMSHINELSMHVQTLDLQPV